MDMNATKQNPKAMGVLNRILTYMLHYYGPLFALVIVCILVSAVATVLAATFPQTLVDDYIVPLIGSVNPDFSGLAGEIIKLAIIMVVGILASFGYNRIMVNVSQGTMRHLRNDLFSKMESLPIQYFDTHPTGTSCRCTPMTWTLCGSCSARAFPRASTPSSPWWLPLSP